MHVKATFAQRYCDVFREHGGVGGGVSTLSKMVASSPALTFDLCQPVLLLVPHWVLRAEGLKATPSRLSSVRVRTHH